MIRVIAGRFRSREIIQPLSSKTRPTQDRVREAIFSALQHSVSGRTVLDLFAGSGAYGFEAVSRGAASAVLVDSSPICRQAMEKTKESLGLEDQVMVVCRDAFSYLRTAQGPFGLVFLDPPYKSLLCPRAIRELQALSLLSDDAIIVAEQETDIAPVDGFALKTYRYGSKRVGILRREQK